jgi:hypothetical protein
MKTANNTTINEFISCLFDNDFSVIDEETFKNIHIEYIDISGQYETAEYEHIKTILILSTRIELIKTYLYIEYQFLSQFERPFLPVCKDLKKFGYTLIWRDNTEDFVKQLENIEQSEKRFIIQLEGERSALEKQNNKQISDSETGQIWQTKQTRKEFIKMIIDLQKQNYKIDRDKTTIEELAIMISDLRDNILATCQDKTL